MATADRCDDCECGRGDLHEMFCTRERCPFCGSQLVSCGCLHSILELSKEESAVVDEYVDDSVDPLKSINERWVSALTEKGRIPLD